MSIPKEWSERQHGRGGKREKMGRGEEARRKTRGEGRVGELNRRRGGERWEKTPLIELGGGGVSGSGAPWKKGFLKREEKFSEKEKKWIYSLVETIQVKKSIMMVSFKRREYNCCYIIIIILS